MNETDDYIVVAHNLTSQKWLDSSIIYDFDENTGQYFDRSIWWHTLQVFIPKKINPEFKNTAVMLIDGGSNKHDYSIRTEFGALEQLLASRVGMYGVPVAILKNVPNEPIWFTDDNVRRSEDAIIAKTWNHFLTIDSETQEGNEWLLRFPMTKAAVKAMDAITDICQQEKYKFGQDENLRKIKNFSVGGASKRGWTTWMAAAVDRRVVTIWPMVLDLLNVNVQMHNIYQSLGGWTFAFKPYFDENITRFIDSNEIELMSRQVDPFYYRKRLTLPKLVISASGDEFFLPDDSHQYFDDMPGKKYVMMNPDVEHGTVEAYSLAILNSVLSMTWHEVNKIEAPEVSWSFGEINGTETERQKGYVDLTILVRNEDKENYSIENVHSWIADPKNVTEGRRDFRLAKADPSYPLNSGQAIFQPVRWVRSKLTIRPKITENFVKMNANEEDDDQDDPQLYTRYHYRVEETFPDNADHFKAMFIKAVITGPFIDNESNRRDIGFTITSETNIFPDVYPFEDCTLEGCYGKLV